MLRRFATNEYTIVVIENVDGGEVGSAPEPGIATLVAAKDHSIAKSYEIVLHPLPFSLPDGATALPNQAATPADQMAAAWAAEMLHIDFYSRGISLPHHQRADFQREWRAIATELGFPTMLHGEDEEPGGFGTDRVIFIGGERARRRRLADQAWPPRYFFSPASMRKERRFCGGGSGQVANGVNAHGGL